MIAAKETILMMLLFYKLEVIFMQLLFSSSHFHCLQNMEFVLVLISETVGKVCSIYAAVLIRAKLRGQIRTYTKMVASRFAVFSLCEKTSWNG